MINWLSIAVKWLHSELTKQEMHHNLPRIHPLQTLILSLVSLLHHLLRHHKTKRPWIWISRELLQLSMTKRSRMTIINQWPARLAYRDKVCQIFMDLISNKNQSTKKCKSNLFDLITLDFYRIEA